MHLIQLCLFAASGRSLQEAPVQAPAPAGDAIVSIINPSGIATAAVPIVDRSNLKVASVKHQHHHHMLFSLCSSRTFKVSSSSVEGIGAPCRPQKPALTWQTCRCLEAWLSGAITTQLIESSAHNIECNLRIPGHGQAWRKCLVCYSKELILHNHTRTDKMY